MPYRSIFRVPTNLQKKLCALARAPTGRDLILETGYRHPSGPIFVSGGSMVEIEVVNWNKYNDRPDRKNYSWFRMQSDFFSDPKVISLSAEAKLLFTYSLCECSRSSNKCFLFMEKSASLITGIKESCIKNCYVELISYGIWREKPAETREKREKAPTDRQTDGQTDEQIYTSNLVNRSGIFEHKDANNQTAINSSSEGSVFEKRFEEIWLKYPSRVGKKAAQKHFYASVKTENDWVEIQTALSNYSESKRVKGGFIMNGSTWFNNWRDWIEQVPGKEMDEFFKRVWESDKGRKQNEN